MNHGHLKKNKPDLIAKVEDCFEDMAPNKLDVINRYELKSLLTKLCNLYNELQEKIR